MRSKPDFEFPQPRVGDIVHVKYGDACRPLIVTGVAKSAWVNTACDAEVTGTEFRSHAFPQLLHGIPAYPVGSGWHPIDACGVCK